MAKRKGNGSAEGHRNAADMNNPGPERAGSAKEAARGGANVPGQGNSGLPEQDDSRSSGQSGASNIDASSRGSGASGGSGGSSASGKQVQKKDIAKAYEKYAEQFTPKPKYFMNSLKAFIVGGLICVVSLWLENRFIASGIPEKDAAAYVVILLVMTAQLLTGLGWFDTIGKHVGAGVIVPITGFANSMVAPAIEYKKDACVIIGLNPKSIAITGFECALVR